jgi:hypothetical protein
LSDVAQDRQSKVSGLQKGVSGLQKIALALLAIGMVAVLVVVLLHPLQRYWLHGPLLGARVEIVEDALGDWRKPTSGSVEPTLVFRYLARMPDGTYTRLTLSRRVPIGTTVEIAFTRGTITGKMFVTAVKQIDEPQP